MMFKKKDYMFVLENVSDPPHIECSLTAHSVVASDVRMQWQQESRKSNRVRLAKQQFCTCSTLFGPWEVGSVSISQLKSLS